MSLHKHTFRPYHLHWSHHKSTSTSPYVTQTNIDTTIPNTIKDLLANLDDKHSKQDTKFKETIADQDEIFDARLEKQLQTVLLHIKEYSPSFC